MTGRVRMGSSDVVHLDNGDRFPMCGGRYGQLPGIPVYGAELTCKKCRRIAEDEERSARERGVEEATTVVVEPMAVEKVEETGLVIDALVEKSLYTVTLAYGAPGNAVTIKGIAADSPREAIRLAYLKCTAEVEQTVTWIGTVE